MQFLKFLFDVQNHKNRSSNVKVLLADTCRISGAFCMLVNTNKVNVELFRSALKRIIEMTITSNQTVWALHLISRILLIPDLEFVR